MVNFFRSFCFALFFRTGQEKARCFHFVSMSHRLLFGLRVSSLPCSPVPCRLGLSTPERSGATGVDSCSCLEGDSCLNGRSRLEGDSCL